MNTQTLFTIKQFAERHPAFTENSLRWIVFRSADKSADCEYAKFSDAIHRVGSKILIEEQKFLDIATGKNSVQAA